MSDGGEAGLTEASYNEGLTLHGSDGALPSMLCS
jgi:hypothetical protein